MYLLFQNKPKNMGYINLTGRFPYKSAKGNQYILVAYHIDANAIYGQAWKTENQILSKQPHLLLQVQEL